MEDFSRNRFNNNGLSYDQIVDWFNQSQKDRNNFCITVDKIVEIANMEYEKQNRKYSEHPYNIYRLTDKHIILLFELGRIHYPNIYTPTPDVILAIANGEYEKMENRAMEDLERKFAKMNSS